MFFFFQFEYLYLSRDVRRRGEYSTLKSRKWCMVSIWQIWGDKEFLSFIGGKGNESRHLVF
jgi:hypothetical protein